LESCFLDFLSLCSVFFAAVIIIECDIFTASSTLHFCRENCVHTHLSTPLYHSSCLQNPAVATLSIYTFMCSV
jgi:hypothetical protein